MGLQRVGRDWVCMHAVTFSEPQLSLFLYCPLNKILFWDSHVEDAGINSQANGTGKVHETSVCFSNIHFMALDQLKEHNQCQVVFNNPVSVKFLGWTWKKKIGRNEQMTASCGCAEDLDLTWVPTPDALHTPCNTSKKLRNLSCW